MINGFDLTWMDRLTLRQFNSKKAQNWPRFSRTHLAIHPMKEIKGFSGFTRAVEHTKQRYIHARANYRKYRTSPVVS